MSAIDDWMSRETRFKRAGKGYDTIHLATCRHVEARGLPWVWAEGRELASIAAAVHANGLRACGTCKPLDGPL